MNNTFQNFLNTRVKKNECEHGKDMWCDKCIAHPKLRRVVLPNGVVTHGYIFTND